jgi:hypothetical protein
MEKRINAAERLLNQSTERLTKQLELFNQMHSFGIDTTEAERVLKIMQQTLAQQIDRLETLLHERQRELLRGTEGPSD